MSAGHLRPILALALALAAPASLALAGETAERSLEYETALSPGKTLHVENLLGSLVLNGGGEAGRVLVRARVVAEAKTPEQAAELADAVELTPANDASTVRVHTSFPVDRHAAFRTPRAEASGPVSRWLGPLLRRGTVSAEYGGRTVEVGNAKGAVSLTVHLEVHVPFDVQVSLRQVAGSVECARFRGTLAVDLADGRLETNQVHGSLSARTGGADLAVNSFRGERLELQTGAGAIEVANVNAERAELRSDAGPIVGRLVEARALQVRSGSGNVELTDVEPGAFEFETDSGALELASRLRRSEGGRIRSGKGDVTLRLGGLTSFELVAATGSGSLKYKDLELEVLERDGEVTRLKHRAGGRLLEVTTAGGDVTLRQM